MITRAQWGADKVSFDPLPTRPVNTIFLHHTATRATTDGAKDMRNIESGEQAMGYSTIAYHECGHPSGDVYEGRPLTALGAATAKNNSVSLAYCFIGNFQNDMPTSVALEACAQRLAGWVRSGAAKADFVLRPHSDVFATACCGTNLKPKIGWIRGRVKEILDGGIVPPASGGKIVMKSMNFNAVVKTDGSGNGYVDVYHGQNQDPIASFCQANGGISNGKYPEYTPLFWTAGRDGTHVRVTVVKCQPDAQFSFKIKMDW